MKGAKTGLNFVQTQIFDKIYVGEHMFDPVGFFWIFALTWLIFPLLHQLLLIVHIFVFIVFLVCNEWHKNGIVSAEGLSLVFQIFL